MRDFDRQQYLDGLGTGRLSPGQLATFLRSLPDRVEGAARMHGGSEAEQQATIRSAMRQRLTDLSNVLGAPGERAGGSAGDADQAVATAARVAELPDEEWDADAGGQTRLDRTRALVGELAADLYELTPERDGEDPEAD